MKKLLEEILKKMESVEYGFLKEEKDYVLQSPEELMLNKKGICWDQVELERYYLDKYNITFKSYFIIEYDECEYPTHTFIVVNDNDKCYWLEHSWKIYKGIREYDSLDFALTDIKSKFTEMLKRKNISLDEVRIYEYSKPEYGISSNDFFKHCESGKLIVL